MNDVQIVIPDFDTTPGNWLCLDFTHTLSNRYNEDRKELLESYRDVVAWGLYEDLLKAEEAQQLLREAGRHEKEAAAALQRAIMLREAVYRVFYDLSQEHAPAQYDLDVLNSMLAEAMARARIVPAEHGFTWDWEAKGHTLDIVLWMVARSAADLLTSERLPDVRACAADDCKWLFLDISKNHSRRWCDMQTCGNQAKARRHYSRKKGA